MIIPQVYLGMDQNGSGKPYASALLYQNKKTKSRKLQLFYSPSLDPLALQQNLKAIDPNIQFNSRLGIFIDCVFGLPAEVFPKTKTLRSLFKDADQSSETFGLKAGDEFFSRFLPSPVLKANFPKRKCESLAQANSVFTHRPFQKNIQTGSFRTWKELGQFEEAYNLWPFDLGSNFKDAKPSLFEVYPSLFWKKTLGFPKRNASLLLNLIKTAKIDFSQTTLIEKDPNLADAAAAALAAHILFKQKEFRHSFLDFPLNKQTEKEGWIFGLENH